MDTNVIEQPGNPECEGEGQLIIDTEAAGEYIEELCDDPLADKKDTKTDSHDAPLDLTTRIEAGEQSRQSSEDMDKTSCQASVEDNSELPTEAELEAEIERVKEGVVENHLLYNQWKQWECRACKHICDAPYRLREHILSCHFEGPLQKCRFCEVFCKTEASLRKHEYCKHRDERNMEKNCWEVAKENAKAASTMD